jgi:hypothetical protein
VITIWSPMTICSLSFLERISIFLRLSGKNKARPTPSILASTGPSVGKNRHRFADSAAQTARSITTEFRGWCSDKSFFRK